MNEKLNTLNDFRENFLNGKLDIKDTVIYGMGKQTEYLLDEFRDYPFVAILDGYCSDGFFHSKPIVSLKSLEGKDIRILIVARKASEKIIYRRIREFCNTQNILVYNLQGELLCVNKLNVNNPYFNINKENLIDAINSHDNISFDIFDTLLVRKVLYQEEIFALVEQRCKPSFNYKNLRVHVEKELSRKKVPTIYDIYDEIQKVTNISYIERENLLKSEIEVEKQSLIIREEMLDVYEHAIKNGKNVSLISDMYLSKSVLEDILYNLGIKGYKKLYISSEYGTDKAKRLFEIYKNEIEPRKCLHIGDSEFFDGECALTQGIDCFIIKNSSEMFDISLLSNEINNNLISELSFSRLFNNPFALYNCNGRVKISNPFDVGYCILAPILVIFLLWLKQNLLQDEIDRILFISRDGYLLKMIYDKMACEDKKLPKSEYLLISRNLGIATTIENEKDIIEAEKYPFAGSKEEMLKKRFYLVRDKCNSVLDYKEAIIKRAAELRKDYEKYLHSFNLKDEKVAVFDFVSTGTVQMCLEKLLNKKLNGYYYQKIDTDNMEKQALFIKSFIENYECDNYFMLEPMIKETTPSISLVNANGLPVYFDEFIDINQQETVKKIQSGALAFVEDFIKFGGLDIEKYSLNFFNVINENYLEFDFDLINYDSFTNRKINL